MLEDDTDECSTKTVGNCRAMAGLFHPPCSTEETGQQGGCCRCIMLVQLMGIYFTVYTDGARER